MERSNGRIVQIHWPHFTASRAMQQSSCCSLTRHTQTLGARETSPIAPEVTALVARGRDSSRELYMEIMEAFVGLVGLGAPVGGGCAGAFVDAERVPLPPQHCRLGNADVVVARCRAPNSCV